MALTCFSMLSFESREAPRFYTQDDALMLDSPTFNETFLTNFALRWDTKTITSVLSVFSLSIGHSVIQKQLSIRVSNMGLNEK